MSHPNPYHPDTSFADAAINNVGGRSTIDATKLDKELSAASESINKTVDNIKMIQRDDGRLKDAAVEVHTLSREVLMLLGKYRSRGSWMPDSDFLAGDVASNDSFLYVCVIAHRSGLSFVEAPNWQRFGFAGSSDAALAAAQAQSAANSAASSAITATAAANTSITKASESSTAASTATSAAGSASTSSADAATAANQAINANAAAQAAAAASQAAATTSGITNTRIVYGDDASKTSGVATADLAVASGFYESSADVPSAGKWLIYTIKSKTGGELIQRAFNSADPNQEFTRQINGGVKTPWIGAGLLQKQIASSFTTTGTAPTYMGAFTPAATTLSINLRAQVTVHVTNGGAASTLNVNGLGAKSLKQYDSTGALVDAMLYTSQVVDVVYNGTVWVVLTPAPYYASGAGEVSYFARSTAPVGYVKANGALVSRTTYAALFAAIGTTFGAGDGSTTFALPDLRAEFVRGWDDGRGIDSGRVLGTSQGSQNLAHSHNYGTGAMEGKFTVKDPMGTGAGASSLLLDSASNGGFGSFAPSDWMSIRQSGGSEARPRNIALLACIKY